MLADLDEAARTADNSSARVGALRSRAATARDLVGLLAWTGLAPGTPEQWVHQHHVVAATEAVRVLTERYGIDPAEIATEIDKRLPSAPLRLGAAA